MHVAASDPRFALAGEVTPEMLATEREIARAQAAAAGKPAQVVERIAEGKVEKFYQETVLTEQAFVKDPEKTVGQVIVERGGKEALDAAVRPLQAGRKPRPCRSARPRRPAGDHSRAASRRMSEAPPPISASS